MTEENKQTKVYPVSTQLLQAIVNYLQTKPWAEVNSLLAAIQQVAHQIDGPPPMQMPEEQPAQAQRKRNRAEPANA